MNPKKIFIFIILAFITPLIIGLFLSFLFIKNIYGKVLPNVYLNNEKIGGLSFEQTYDHIQNISLPTTILFEYQNQIFEIESKKIDLQVNVIKTTNNIFQIGRSGDIKSDFENLINKKINTNLEINFDKTDLKKEIGVIAENITTSVIYPQIIVENNTIKLTKGQIGNQININNLINLFEENYKNQNFEKITLILDTIDPTLTTEKEQEILKLANKINSKKIILKFENYIYEIKNLSLFINPNDNFLIEKINSETRKVASDLNIDSQNPIFKFENNKVVEFKPSITGIKVKENELSNKILQALLLLAQNEETNIFIDIPVETTKPEYETEEINNLGIKEIIGVGTSKFIGSIPSRIYNISLATSRVSGHLVAPGDTFSFNDAVGDISALSGYKEAYVIKDGKTTLGDGGGVCQVSTTLFRAALNAGFPIIERKSHSYRVGYYEQDAAVGLDATIYSPITDLKFKNDTSHHILLQATFDGKASTLKLEIYGTSDGRKVTLSKPIIYDQSPPPDDTYIDDPTLPMGTIKQIEYKAWGAKSKFEYKVEKDNKVLFETTFYSSYRPWGAVFLRGTSI